MSNLDYKVRLELRHELRALQQRVGITAVYVTHDREEALTLADRIAVLDAGRVVQIGTPEEIFQRPASAFVARLHGRRQRARRSSPPRRARTLAGERRQRRRHRRTARAFPQRRRAARTAAPRRRRRRSLVIDGVIAQPIYVGQGWRYRVRAAGADIWVDAPERMAEGAPRSVVVPVDALLHVSRSPKSSHEREVA